MTASRGTCEACHQAHFADPEGAEWQTRLPHHHARIAALEKERDAAVGLLRDVVNAHHHRRYHRKYHLLSCEACIADDKARRLLDSLKSAKPEGAD